MKKIRLSQNKFALIDDEDFEELNKHEWYVCKDRKFLYAVRDVRSGIKRILVRMHREIMKPPENMQIDHINHNGLDNRKSNLRVCTNSQNQYNQKIRKNLTSGCKGVSWKKQTKRWMAHIGINRTKKHLGYYSSEKEAAIAYNNAAKELFGDFALLNVVGQ